MLSADFLGVVLALLSAICAAATQALLSRPIVKSDVSSVAFFTVVIGLFIVATLTFISEWVYFLQPLSLLIIVLFAGVGVFQYGISRRIFYSAIRNLGANITAPIITITMIIGSVILAVLILNEQLTEIVAVGISLVLVGALLLEGRMAAGMRGGNSRVGYIAAIAAGIIPAFTSIMISYGLSVYHYVIASVFISYAAASVFYLITVRAQSVVGLVRGTPKNSLILFFLAGIFAISTQILRAGALDLAPVILAMPFLTSSNLFIPLLTWRLAKDLEVFNFRTILGIVIITAGLILITI